MCVPSARGEHIDVTDLSPTTAPSLSLSPRTAEHYHTYGELELSSQLVDWVFKVLAHTPPPHMHMRGHSRVGRAGNRNRRQAAHEGDATHATRRKEQSAAQLLPRGPNYIQAQTSCTYVCVPSARGEHIDVTDLSPTTAPSLSLSPRTAEHYHTYGELELSSQLVDWVFKVLAHTPPPHMHMRGHSISPLSHSQFWLQATFSRRRRHGGGDGGDCAEGACRGSPLASHGSWDMDMDRCFCFPTTVGGGALRLPVTGTQRRAPASRCSGRNPARSRRVIS